MLGLNGRKKKSQPDQEQPPILDQEVTTEQSNAQNVGISSTKSRGRPKGSSNRASAQAGEIARIRGALTVAFTGVETIVGMRNQIDGAIIKAGAPALIDSLCQLAEQDKSVRVYLLSLTINSAYLNVIGSLLFGIIIPILANHNLLPPLFAPQAQQAPANNTPMEIDEAAFFRP